MKHLKLPNKKYPYLNVGCGSKFHSDWINVDMNSKYKDVISINLLKGFPFDDNTFSVVYHSHVLEHIPREKSLAFLRECFRVLKPNGIIRVEVPNLESISREYLRLLEENVASNTSVTEACYDWIMLEMYDQVVRNYPQGEMGKWLKDKNLINMDYVNQRIGDKKHSIDVVHKKISNNVSEDLKKMGISEFIFKIKKKTIKKIKKIYMSILILLLGEPYRLGAFRISGEIHYWMYDRFSLGRILTKAGFIDLKILKRQQSDITDWNLFNLESDIQHPDAVLIIEAKKL